MELNLIYGLQQTSTRKKITCDLKLVSNGSLSCEKQKKKFDSKNLHATEVKRTNIYQNMRNFMQKC
jgi:hypothetical protein